MEPSSAKKVVRFSSPFETAYRPEVTVIQRSTVPTANGQRSSKRKIPESTTADKELLEGNCSDKGNELSPSNSGDSWDAFDAKMMTSKKLPARKVVKEFLELSINQNKSLNMNMEGDDDFDAMSFRDAGELIEQDENERLQFMNSELSFGGQELDDVEAPSLLSFTSYFQAGSSFPVPWAGNDSTMMVGGKLPPGISSSFLDSQSQLASETLRRFSNYSQQLSLPDSSFHRRTSTSKAAPAALIDSTMGSTVHDKSEIARQDSLAKFFLGPEAKGMDKQDIMEHVLDYCKRRASFRNSDNSTLHSSSSREASISEGIDSDPTSAESQESRPEAEDVHDKTLVDPRTEMEAKAHNNNSNSTTTIVNLEDAVRAYTNGKAVDLSMITDRNQEESILFSDGASTKDKGGAFMDISDVGGTDGFEKFKKNLIQRHPNGEDRYRAKMKHHEQFEKKRLQLDERCSHPQLSPTSLSRAGATASLERPSKRLLCNSPPEKLVIPRSQLFPDENIPVVNSQEIQAPRMSDGQLHSTPVGAETLTRKITNMNDHKVSKDERVKSSRKSVGPTRAETDKEDSHRMQRVYARRPDSGRSDSARSDTSAERPSSGSQIRRKSPLLDERYKQRYTQPPKAVHQQPTSSSSENEASNLNVLKLSNAIPPQTLSVVPVIHSTGQQYQQSQHLNGNQQCTCHHQCGQQPAMSHGIQQGLPIVIHIHLPYPTPTSGAVITPVSTPTTEAPPK